MSNPGRSGGRLTAKQSQRALRHVVRDGVVRSIIHGELGPGDRLVEMSIAREYGTSQGPVREALRELEMLGFVTSSPHRGTYVRDPWQRGMLELYEVRAALEDFATRIATPALSQDVAPLQDHIDAMTDAAARDDVAGVVDHSERFHRTILEASGNELLLGVWNGLGISDHTELTMIALSLDLALVGPSHQPIVDAIAAGDPERAGQASRDHQVWFEDLLTTQTAETHELEPEAEPEPAA